MQANNLNSFELNQEKSRRAQIQQRLNDLPNERIQREGEIREAGNETIRETHRMVEREVQQSHLEVQQEEQDLRRQLVQTDQEIRDLENQLQEQERERERTRSTASGGGLFP
jgi:Na+/phosphate symporter